MIKTKNDALKVIGRLEDDEMFKLYPSGYYGNLEVCITKDGCREFWNGSFGEIGNDDQATIASMLYKYRKAFNERLKLMV